MRNNLVFLPLHVAVTCIEPISVSERYAVYKSSRVAARQSVAELTTDLQQVLEGLLN